MTCPQQLNIETKRVEKQTIGVRNAGRCWYHIRVVPIVVGTLGGGMKKGFLGVTSIK